MDPRQVIIRPVVSEKSYALMADGKYTFRVHDRAHKTQIAQAVELGALAGGLLDRLRHDSLLD